MPQHAYGRKKDAFDGRDYKFSAPAYVANPDSVDLRDQCSPVRDQGNLGSCVGFGCTTGMREFMEIKANPEPPTPPPPPEPPTPPVPPSPPTPLTPASALAWVISLLQWLLAQFFGTTKVMELISSFVTLSPLFNYYQARSLEGSTNYDAGAEVRDGLKALQKMGVCPESDWPYITSKYAQKPSLQAISDAVNYKIASYTRLSSLLDMQTCLAGGNGVVIGFDVYESFEGNDVAATGKMPMPKAGEQFLGGHCVFVVGYTKDPTWAGGGYLICKNSWSTDWGDRIGFFYDAIRLRHCSERERYLDCSIGLMH